MSYPRFIIIMLLIFAFAKLHAQDKAYAKQVMDTLASPAMLGRGYVNHGDSLAAAYVKSEFQKIGLQPVSGSFFQAFQHNVNTFPEKLLLKFDGNLLKPGAEYLVDPASGAGKGKNKTELLTYQDILNNKWLEKIKKNKNKILLIDLRGHDSTSPSETKILNDFYEYLKHESNISAKALVFLHDKKMPWYVSSVQALRPSFFVFADSVQTLPKEVTFEVDAQFKENYTSKNVIGFLPGIGDADSCLVITAHYDHLGKMGQATYFPGANDNASGVAMMLNLAKAFKENPPEYNIYFIAFAGEEAGLLGSRYFVDHPLFPLQNIKFLLNIDLAGTGVDGVTVVNGTVYPKYFELLKATNEKMNLLKQVKARGEACNSDHCFFYRKGVPSFFIYTLGGTTFYHDIYDEAETLPLNEYSNYFKLLYNFIKDI